MRITLDARLMHMSGGVEQAAIGVAAGLGQAEPNGDRSYVTYEGQSDWLRPYVGQGDMIVEQAPSLVRRTNSRLIGAARRAGPLWTTARAVRSFYPKLAGRDRTIDSLRPDVVHFLTQVACETNAPNVYSPHDLQHRHLPEMFSASDRRWRDRTYSRWCQRAAAVIVMTEWGRADVIQAYSLDPSKVHVVPWASVLDLYGAPTAISDVRSKYKLPTRFLLYPARVYRHKNHARLFEALRMLDDDGFPIPVVLTGGGTSDPDFRRLVIEARLQGLVHTLGFVPDSEMRALFAMSHGLIFPSLFEGFGMPALEAMACGCPVVCSNTSSLPEIAGDAALLRDPLDAEAFADALHLLLSDADLRAELRERGLRQAARFSWRRHTLETIAVFYNLHRQIRTL